MAKGLVVEASHLSEALQKAVTRRSYGMFAILAIFAIVGIAAWLIVNQNATD